ncbi:MAG: polysaccharide biosynthesis/export family protein [Pseudomonadota bacterium]
MKNATRLIITGACFGLIFACHKGAPFKAMPKGPTAEAVLNEYGIGPDDTLLVDVWKHPELSREVIVRPDGFISLPLVNDVRASGVTARDLSTLLKARFKDFVEDPEVAVAVKIANSYKIYVVGKVATSGMFTVKTPTSVLQAVAMAGGFTPFASPDNMLVLRKENGQDIRLDASYDDIVKGRHPEKNITLRPGDTLVVP